VARLKLFAQARECAGTGESTIDGGTVGEVLDAAVERFGTPLDAVIAMSTIWLNGEETRRDEAVESSDEVAVLPPVSGG
jgi:molybdopterin converting factor small subunit